MSATPNDLVEVGHVLDAQGVRGQLKVKPYSNDPEALLVAKKVWLIPSRSSTLPKDIPILFKVESSRFHSGNIVLQLSGVGDRDQALALKGCVTSVSRADFPELDEDEFYWSDLIGLEVKNLQGQTLGLVEEMLDNGAQSILAIRSEAKKQQLVPFVSTVIQDVNLADRTILVDWQLDW